MQRKVFNMSHMYKFFVQYQLIFHLVQYIYYFMLNETQTVDSTSIYSYVHSKQSDSELFSSLQSAFSANILFQFRYFSWSLAFWIIEVILVSSNVQMHDTWSSMEYIIMIECINICNIYDVLMGVSVYSNQTKELAIVIQTHIQLYSSSSSHMEYNKNNDN